MKKYAIKDDKGYKKIIYAKDLAHAMTFVDNNIRDDFSRQINSAISRGKLTTRPYSGKYAMRVSKSDFESLKKELEKLGYENIIFESNPYVSYNVFFTDNNIRDEANLPTTLQALINDEDAAIKSYEVAIKNLEGKIDENAMQVLINIMKDERKHVENLYAILNGQVTEKNLEDSVHDAFIVKADNEYIMEGNKPEMTSIRKYAKLFPSKKEAIDYARKYFRLRPIDIEIIEE